MPSEDWIPIKEAAQLMHTNEKKLGQRAADGSWLHYPKLSRLQPNGPNTKIWLLRSEVLAWIDEVEADARAQTISPVVERAGQSYGLSKEAIDLFRRTGQVGILKRFGVEA